MPSALVVRVESVPVPGAILHRAIIVIADDDGREVAIDVEPGAVPRVSAACFDHEAVEVVSDGERWRVVLKQRAATCCLSVRALEGIEQGAQLAERDPLDLTDTLACELPCLAYLVERGAFGVRRDECLDALPVRQETRRRADVRRRRGQRGRRARGHRARVHGRAPASSGEAWDGAR